MAEKFTLSFTFLFLFFLEGKAQPPVYTDYVGGGHSEGLIVTASHNDKDPDWSDGSIPEHTINGEGLNGPRQEAARFLFQAALGGDEEEINRLASTLDFEKWIEDQMKLPQTDMLSLTNQVYAKALARNIEVNGENDDYPKYDIHFQFAWWQAAMTKPDILRQRIAFALSEILVISKNSNIRNEGDALASYYNVLLEHAFGNYRDLLEAVTKHPAMGVYLSHFRNGKTDLENNTFPDENYAREIMQLFSIGLYELNQDGSYKTDVNGNRISTYGDEDIRNLAKVLTGLGAGGLTQEGLDIGRELNFLAPINLTDLTVPMVMYDDFHEPGQKVILGDKIIPDGQTGEEDLDMALDYLFNHPNVGPFISKRLIQQLIKSNPSPGYIADVASVFNDNGDGERGDLAAVIKEILLHDEARTCEWSEHPENGKLKSPVGRYVQFARLFALNDEVANYWTSGFRFQANTYQLPLASPSVFNFYLPDHQPNGELADNGLYAPEFEIYNSVTSVGYANEADTWIRQGKVFNIQKLNYEVHPSFQDYQASTEDAEVLINELNTVLALGNLSDPAWGTISEAVSSVVFGDDLSRQRLEMALYLIMISPEYNIQK